MLNELRVVDLMNIHTVPNDVPFIFHDPRGSEQGHDSKAVWRHDWIYGIEADGSEHRHKYTREEARKWAEQQELLAHGVKAITPVQATALLKTAIGLLAAGRCMYWLCKQTLATEASSGIILFSGVPPDECLDRMAEILGEIGYPQKTANEFERDFQSKLNAQK